MEDSNGSAPSGKAAHQATDPLIALFSEHSTKVRAQVAACRKNKEQNFPCMEFRSPVIPSKMEYPEPHDWSQHSSAKPEMTPMERSDIARRRQSGGWSLRRPAITLDNAQSRWITVDNGLFFFRYYRPLRAHNRAPCQCYCSCSRLWVSGCCVGSMGGAADALSEFTIWNPARVTASQSSDRTTFSGSYRMETLFTSKLTASTPGRAASASCSFGWSASLWRSFK